MHKKTHKNIEKHENSQTKTEFFPFFAFRYNNAKSPANK